MQICIIYHNVHVQKEEEERDEERDEQLCTLNLHFESIMMLLLTWTMSLVQVWGTSDTSCCSSSRAISRMAFLVSL